MKLDTSHLFKHKTLHKHISLHKNETGINKFKSKTMKMLTNTNQNHNHYHRGQSSVEQAFNNLNHEVNPLLTNDDKQINTSNRVKSMS